MAPFYVRHCSKVRVRVVIRLRVRMYTTVVQEEHPKSVIELVWQIITQQACQNVEIKTKCADYHANMSGDIKTLKYRFQN